MKDFKNDMKMIGVVIMSSLLYTLAMTPIILLIQWLIK